MLSIVDLALKFSLVEDATRFGECLLARKNSVRVRTEKSGLKSVADPDATDAYWAYSVLGRAAAEQGHLSLAEQYLVLMTKHLSKVSDLDLMLARSLLDAGKIPTVLSYLKVCAKKISEQTKLDLETTDESTLKLSQMIRDRKYPDKTVNEAVIARGNEKVGTLLNWITDIEAGKSVSMCSSI